MIHDLTGKHRKQGVPQCMLRTDGDIMGAVIDKSTIISPGDTVRYKEPEVVNYIEKTVVEILERRESKGIWGHLEPMDFIKLKFK